MVPGTRELKVVVTVLPDSIVFVFVSELLGKLLFVEQLTMYPEQFPSLGAVHFIVIEVGFLVCKTKPPGSFGAVINKGYVVPLV